MSVNDVNNARKTFFREDVRKHTTVEPRYFEVPREMEKSSK